MLAGGKNFWKVKMIIFSNHWTRGSAIDWNTVLTQLQLGSNYHKSSNSRPVNVKLVTYMSGVLSESAVLAFIVKLP